MRRWTRAFLGQEAQPVESVPDPEERAVQESLIAELEQFQNEVFTRFGAEDSRAFLNRNLRQPINAVARAVLPFIREDLVEQIRKVHDQTGAKSPEANASFIAGVFDTGFFKQGRLNAFRAEGQLARRREFFESFRPDRLPAALKLAVDVIANGDTRPMGNPWPGNFSPVPSEIGVDESHPALRAFQAARGIAGGITGQELFNPNLYMKRVIDAIQLVAGALGVKAFTRPVSEITKGADLALRGFDLGQFTAIPTPITPGAPGFVLMPGTREPLPGAILPFEEAIRRIAPPPPPPGEFIPFGETPGAPSEGAPPPPPPPTPPAGGELVLTLSDFTEDGLTLVLPSVVMLINLPRIQTIIGWDDMAQLVDPVNYFKVKILQARIEQRRIEKKIKSRSRLIAYTGIAAGVLGALIVPGLGLTGLWSTVAQGVSNFVTRRILIDPKVKDLTRDIGRAIRTFRENPSAVGELSPGIRRISELFVEKLSDSIQEAAGALPPDELAAGTRGIISELDRAGSDIVSSFAAGAPTAEMTESVQAKQGKIVVAAPFPMEALIIGGSIVVGALLIVLALRGGNE